MQRIEQSYAKLRALHDAVAARPNIAAYRSSPRCMAFNERGVFRHIDELDA
jgi:glutathione S-transferase